MNVEERITSLENRLNKVEDVIFAKQDQQPLVKKKYEGLTGGIKMLIDSNFLDEPKSAREIADELTREGYYNVKESVDKLLRVDFLKNKKIIMRIKDGKVWKYVKRK